MLWLGTERKQAHYCDVIMRAVVSQITSLTIVYSTVYSDADQRKHQSSASLASVRGIHRGHSLHKWTVTRKMFPFDDVTWISNAYVIYEVIWHQLPQWRELTTAVAQPVSTASTALGNINYNLIPTIWYWNNLMYVYIFRVFQWAQILPWMRSGKSRILIRTLSAAHIVREFRMWIYMWFFGMLMKEYFVFNRLGSWPGPEQATSHYVDP